MFRLLRRIFRGIHRLKNAENEDALANSVALELAGLCLEGRLNAVWFHVPNETVVQTRSHLFSLIKKKSIGLIPGVADFVLVSQGKTLFVELKTAQGRLSDNQEDFKVWCEIAGLKYAVCRSVADLRILLRDEGLLQ